MVFLALLTAVATLGGGPLEGRQEESAPPSPPEPAVVLPPGPMAEAWAAREGRWEKPALPEALAWPTWPTGPAWTQAGPWERWRNLVRAEAEAETPDPQRRAALALLAARQGRSQDAWAHAAVCAEAPHVLTALLLPLALGVDVFAPASDPNRPLGPDGMPRTPLPDGVLLRPILPPLHGDPPFGRPRVRELVLRGVPVGEARLDVTLKVELDGVELIFRHADGGTARLQAILPQPADRELRAMYVDWVRLDEVPETVLLEIRPGDEERSIWGRFHPRSTPWPDALPEALSPSVLTGGLAVEVEPGDPDAPRLERAAAFLGALLGVPARVVRPGEVRTGHSATVLRFPLDLAPDLREAKLAAMLSLAERYALGSR